MDKVRAAVLEQTHHLRRNRKLMPIWQAQHTRDFVPTLS